MLGVAQILLGEAIVANGGNEIIRNFIQLSGGGTIAVGIYFLMFLARHEDEFTAAYNKAEKRILERDPESGQKVLVDASRPGVTAAWYTIPVVMTFIGLVYALVV
jgi:hypothetical protein